jgi:UDP-2,3-diacylglucosamine hydrolase
MLPALPSVHPFKADALWQTIDFISDLHLSEQTPQTYQAWQHYMTHTQADAVFILGDLVEVWVGDDARHEPGFDSNFAAALTQAARLRPTYFMAGNRDFLMGSALFEACGVGYLPEPTLIEAFGQRGLLIHGDQLCLADTAYLGFRQTVRAPAWQQQFLSQPLAQRRQTAQSMREQSQIQQLGRGQDTWADVDACAARAWLEQAGASFMIHGHTHRPGSQSLGPEFTRHVLSDWDLELGALQPRAQVLRWSSCGFERYRP